MNIKSQMKILTFLIVSVFALGAVAVSTDAAYANDSPEEGTKEALILELQGAFDEINVADATIDNNDDITVIFNNLVVEDVLTAAGELVGKIEAIVESGTLHIGETEFILDNMDSDALEELARLILGDPGLAGFITGDNPISLDYFASVVYKENGDLITLDGKVNFAVFGTKGALILDLQAAFETIEVADATIDNDFDITVEFTLDDDGFLDSAAILQGAEDLGAALLSLVDPTSTLTIEETTFILNEDDVMTKLAEALLGEGDVSGFLATGILESPYSASVGYKNDTIDFDGNVTFKAIGTLGGLLNDLNAEFENITVADAEIDENQDITVEFNTNDASAIQIGAEALGNALLEIVSSDSVLTINGQNFTLGDVDMTDLVLALLNGGNIEDAVAGFLATGTLESQYSASVGYKNTTIDLSGSLTFNVERYTVTFGKGITVKDGEIPITSGDKVVHGTELTVTAAKEGYRLVSLKAGDDAITDGKHTLVADVTFTAEWIQQFTVTFDEETITVLDDEVPVTSGQKLDVNTELTVTAAKEGYRLVSLKAGDDAITDGKHTLVADVTFTAQWVTETGIDVNDLFITIAGDFTFTGSVIKPTVTVMVNEGGEVLVLDADYELSYGDNVNVMDGGSVTIEGIGDYTGTKTIIFEITQKNVTVTLTETSKVYDGEDIEPGIVFDGEIPGFLVDDNDFTVEAFRGDEATEDFKNVGIITAKFTSVATSNYNVTGIVTFEITPKAITITPDSGQEMEYTGSAPANIGFGASDGFTDYDGALGLKIDGNVATTFNVGDYTIYLGTLASTDANYELVLSGDVDFEITPKDLTGATVTVKDVIFDGADGTPQKPVPTVKLGEKTLVAGVDFTVDYTDNTAIGTAKATVTGKGNYEGTVGPAEFAIKAIDKFVEDVIVADEKPKVEMNESVAEKEIPVTVFEKLAEEKKTLVIDITDDEGETLYSWTFEGEYDETKEISFKASIAAVAEPEKKVSDAIESFGLKEDESLVLNFAASGEFPMKTTVKYKVGDKFENGKKLALYFFDEDKGLVDQGRELVVEDGYVIFALDHSSVYIIGEPAAAGDEAPDYMPVIGITLASIVVVILALFIILNRRK